MQYVILPLLVAVAEAAFRQSLDGTELQLRAERISPRLEPKSDKKFFDKDYPWDKRPVADKYYVFDHPYPAVQDSGDFDKDFVKDENSDGGKWKAQMEYDTLRSKIRAAKDKLKPLKEKMEDEYEDWMAAKDKAANGVKEVEQAGGATAKAKTAAAGAAKEVNDLEGASQKDGTKVGGGLGDAVKKVQDEMKDLEKCKEALAAAKKRLQDLMKEKEAFDKKKIEKKAAAEAKKKAAEKAEAEETEKETTKKKEANAAAKKEAKDDAEEDKKRKEAEDESKFDEKAWTKKLDMEKADHSKALTNYEQQLKDVKLTEHQLAQAADNLRKFRRPPHVDDNGGVYYVPDESFAVSARAPVAIILAVFAACFAA